LLRKASSSKGLLNDGFEGVQRRSQAAVDASSRSISVRTEFLLN
jgi:hypothetical protein